MTLGTRLALELFRTRIILSECGAIGEVHCDYGNTWVGVLPGGFIVRLSRIGKNHRGQLYCPDGATSGPEANLADVGSLALFMHLADVAVAKHVKGLPIHLFTLADQIAWETMNGKLNLQVDDELDFPDHLGDWSLSGRARELISRADDTVGLKALARFNREVAGESRRADWELYSVLRWNEQADIWHRYSNKIRSVSIAGGGFAWHLVQSSAGMAGACLRIGPIVDISRGARIPMGILVNNYRMLANLPKSHPSSLERSRSFYWMKTSEGDVPLLASVRKQDGAVTMFGRQHHPLIKPGVEMLKGTRHSPHSKIGFKS